jgi:hypothetical protein
MTIKELKEKLEGYPDDYLVYLYDDIEDFQLKAKYIDLVDEDSYYFDEVDGERGITIRH